MILLGEWYNGDMADETVRPERRVRTRFNIQGASVHFKKTVAGTATRYACPLIDIGRGGLEFVAPIAIEPEERIVVAVSLPKKSNYLKLVSLCRWCNRIEGTDAFRVGLSFDRYGTGIEKRLTSLEMQFGFLGTSSEGGAGTHANGGPSNGDDQARPLFVEDLLTESGDTSVVAPASEAEVAEPQELPADIPPEFAGILSKFQDFAVDDTTIEDILDVLGKGTHFDDLTEEGEADKRPEVMRTLVPVHDMTDSLPSAFDATGAPADEVIAYVFLPNMPDTPAFCLRVNREAALGEDAQSFAKGDLLFFCNSDPQDADHALVVTEGKALFGQVFFADECLRIRSPNEAYQEQKLALEDVTAMWRMVAKVEHV